VCILQEALANVRKHAGAKNVRVTLSRDDRRGKDCICLEVVDDGKGFQKNQSKRSFGLQTMEERADSVGGNLLIHSTPGEGTTINCCLPCLPEEEVSNRSIILSV